ncbi:MAG TPA: pilus assembly protein PilE [Moraxella sp.]|nr:pilus assembly protein PilE [Moraxella sp.]
MKNRYRQQGFTLIELMIVVALIGILAAIAYPSYQRYVIKTKRTDMMTEMQNIASQIESRKLAQGSYTNAGTGLDGSFPRSGTALYTIDLAPTPLTDRWTITAKPVSPQMVNDGTLTLNAQGLKCRGSSCGMGQEWNN